MSRNIVQIFVLLILAIPILQADSKSLEIIKILPESKSQNINNGICYKNAQLNNFDQVIERLNSPEKISKFMLKNITYTSSTQRKNARKNEYWWKTPQETFSDGHGFCYDLSAFALYCLIKNNYTNAKVLFVCWGDWGKRSNTGHLVCIFIQNNQLYSIDNGKLKGPFYSVNQLINSASRNRKIKGYGIFLFDEIPFHTPYNKMDYFCVKSNPQDLQ